MTLPMTKRRRTRVLAALGSAVTATVMIAAPSSAQVTPGAGSGSLVGSLSYTSPGVPGDLITCATTTWSLSSTSVSTPLTSVPTAGGFADLNGDDYVGGLAFSGSDSPACEAGWLSTGPMASLRVTNSGPVFQGDSMSCTLGPADPTVGAIKGGQWVRVGALMVIAAWGDCTVHNVPDGFTAFVIEGSWTPTSPPNGSTSITSAELTASWVAAS